MRPWFTTSPDPSSERPPLGRVRIVSRRAVFAVPGAHPGTANMRLGMHSCGPGGFRGDAAVTALRDPDGWPHPGVATAEQVRGRTWPSSKPCCWFRRRRWPVWPCCSSRGSARSAGRDARPLARGAVRHAHHRLQRRDRARQARPGPAASSARRGLSQAVRRARSRRRPGRRQNDRGGNGQRRAVAAAGFRGQRRPGGPRIPGVARRTHQRPGGRGEGHRGRTRTSTTGCTE